MQEAVVQEMSASMLAMVQSVGARAMSLPPTDTTTTSLELMLSRINTCQHRGGSIRTKFVTHGGSVAPPSAWTWAQGKAIDIDALTS